MPPTPLWPSGRWRRRSNAARRPRSWARSGISRAIASPPRAASCSRRAKGGRPRFSSWPAPTGRRSVSPAPPRRGSRSPPRRASSLRRRPAGTCLGRSPAGRGSSRRALPAPDPRVLFRLSTLSASSVWNGEARTMFSGNWLLAIRRFLSLWLPRLATDRARRLNGVDRRAPLAAVAKVNNAERLVCVDAEAARLGLTIGLSLADARARFPNLVAVEAQPMEEARLLERLCDWCSRFTPLAALDCADGLMLDISGVAHLFGGELSDGEAALIEDCRARLAAQGLTVAAGVGGNPRAAWALARFSRTKIAPDPLSDKAFAKLFHDLPLAALGLDEKTVADLARA